MEVESCRFRPPEVGRQIIWEVTRFCNLFCDHCCSDSGPTADRRREPATSVLTAAAAELADANIQKVYFSGGEPLLREGFLDLLDAIDTARVRVHIASNGYHLNEVTIARLVSSGVAKLGVSLDGGDAAQHDLLRRKEGAFERSLGGIARAVAAGLRVGVSITVTPANLHSLDPLLATLVDLGVPVASFHTVVPVGRAAQHPELLFPARPAGRIEGAIRDLEDKHGSRIAIDHNLGPGGSRAEKGCPAQRRLLHIDPTGEVSPCSWLYKTDPNAYTLGNIARARLGELVDNYCHALEELLASQPEHCPLPLAMTRRAAT
jgi:MoaA/NifB/PqqE/SkfB family radical SAM enzyme